MKNAIKLLIVIVFGFVGAMIPLSGAIWLWSVAMAAVPAGASAAALKIIISLLMFICGAGLTIWLAIILGGLGVMLASALLDV